MTALKANDKAGDTPRTDAILNHVMTCDDVSQGFNPYFVLAADLAQHARQLERENARLVALIKQMEATRL